MGKEIQLQAIAEQLALRIAAMAEAESAAMASEEGVPPQRLLVLGGTGSTGKWFIGHALNHGYVLVA